MLQGPYVLHSVERFLAFRLLKHKYETGLIILIEQMQLMVLVLIVLTLRTHQLLIGILEAS